MDDAIGGGDVIALVDESRWKHEPQLAYANGWNDCLSRQEVYGYAFQHEETGLQQVVDIQQVEWGFEKNNPRWQKIGPVFRQLPFCGE